MNDEDSARSPRRERALARLRQAPATTALLVVLLIAFVASLIDPGLAWRFAKVSERVRAGEVWRLATASFFHGGVLHVAVNAYALVLIGPAVERVYGPFRFFVLFVLGGAAGFAASTLFVPQPSLGASAGIFAMLGALLGFAVRARNMLPRAARHRLIREILTVAALNLALGLAVPYIDNAAHVGGFLGGLAMSVLLRPRWSA